MKLRAAFLALLLLDLAAGATWYAGRFAHGRPEALRLFLVWALPGLIFLCGMLTRPGQRSLPSPAAGPPPVGGAGVRLGRLLTWIGVALAVDLAPIGIGQRLGWLSFAAGDPQLAANRGLIALWALPLLVLVSIRFSERTLRGQLFRFAEESWGARTAWALALLCGTALALPTIAPGFAFGKPGFVVAALVTAFAREVGCTVLYRASGLVAAGLYRGALAFFDFFLLADGLAPVFPSANYFPSVDSFYLLRAAAPLVAALLLVRALRGRARA